MTKKIKIFALIFLIVIVVIISGCVSKADASRNNEWEKIIDGDTILYRHIDTSQSPIEKIVCYRAEGSQEISCVTIVNQIGSFR